MYVAAYRNTVAGSQAIVAQRKRAAEIMRADEQRAAIESKLRHEAELVAMKAQRDAELAQDRLLRAQEGLRYQRTFRQIEAAICRATKVTRKELRSNRRHRYVVLARQAVAYWTCRLTKFSLPQIGRLMGGLDHTTVLHSKTAYVAKRRRMGRTLRPAR